MTLEVEAEGRAEEDEEAATAGRGVDEDGPAEEDAEEEAGRPTTGTDPKKES